MSCSETKNNHSKGFRFYITHIVLFVMMSRFFSSIRASNRIWETSVTLTKVIATFFFMSCFTLYCYLIVEDFRENEAERKKIKWQALY